MSTEETAHAILVMFSGGLDSTYLLWDYLAHTRHPIHAHHVSLRYPRLRRWEAEDPACERIVAWCREHVRDFEYSTSRFDLDLPAIGWDSDLLLTVAAKVAPNVLSPRVTVAMGWCADDLQRDAVRARQDRAITPTLWRALRASIDELANVGETIAMPLLDRSLTKAELAGRLPRPLVELSWSCRMPRWEGAIPVPCATCHACELRAASLGSTP